MIFPGDTIEVIGNDEQLDKFSIALKGETYQEDPNIEKRETRLHQMVLGKDSPFVGKTLKESGIRDRYNCMVVGVEAGQKHLTIINPKRKFMQGDVIWVVGEEASLQKLPH